MAGVVSLVCSSSGKRFMGRSDAADKLSAADGPSGFTAAFNAGWAIESSCAAIGGIAGAMLLGCAKVRTSSRGSFLNLCGNGVTGVAVRALTDVLLAPSPTAFVGQGAASGVKGRCGSDCFVERAMNSTGSPPGARNDFTVSFVSTALSLYMRLKSTSSCRF